MLKLQLFYDYDGQIIKTGDTVRLVNPGNNPNFIDGYKGEMIVKRFNLQRKMNIICVLPDGRKMDVFCGEVTHKKLEKEEDITSTESLREKIKGLIGDPCEFFGYSSDPGTSCEGCPAENANSCFETALEEIMKQLKSLQEEYKDEFSREI